MPEKGELVPKTSEGAYQSDFIQQFFSNTVRINKRAVEKALQDALKENATTEEGIEKKDKNVIGSYDWAREVGSFLKKSIKTLKKKKESSSPYSNTGGCVLIILYWFCQKTGKIKPISGRENEDHGMRKWDIQKLIKNWPSFNSLKKIEKIFENLKEDREESESEEEENRSDEAKTVPEGEEKGADDQNCENEEDNLEVEVAEQETASEKNKWEKELQKKEEEIRYMTAEKDNLKKKLNEKEQELRKITEDMVNLEERNATLVTENFCLASSVNELEIKLKELEKMLSPKTRTSTAAQQHSSPPPNSTEGKNELNGAASKVAENTKEKDQLTVEEGQSHGICTVKESAEAASQSPPHCTVAEETKSTPPSHKESQFQSPTVHMLTVAEMEQQADKCQIVKSPIVEEAFQLRTLSIEKEKKTPEQSQKGELTMHLTEQHSGETSILLGWKTLLEKESQGLDVPTFMNPLCWHSAENLTVYYVHLYLCEPLFENLARSNYIFFPISDESGFHHTLLIFDKELKKWFHSDSKRPKKSSTGKCFQNVQKMVEMVELWMTAVKEQADDMVEQGCRMKFDEKNSSEEQLKMIEVPLTETERESIRWIKDNYKRKMTVTELKDNHQQGEDSLDCGLFVMYAMEKISKKGKVPKKLTKDDILKFRAHVVKSFVERRNSWNSQHNEV
ncbi:cilia- and flagella-associated protein 251-like [Rosa chinensis]|uniref:cilia- and flagella-associated protein 251-like n=1 Tax=Rosa chinensis TaxID=74649 RepID=UPI001AD8E925|nr:cilia- and flagella-associated protein 251-like [Rosa chinensis]